MNSRPYNGGGAQAAFFDLRFDVAPFRYSGAVFGTLMNHQQALQELGDAASQAPYKAPPKAPVLYITPANALSVSGREVRVPAGTRELEVGGTIGLVMGRAACRLTAERAMDHVAGFVPVLDVSVPHASFYRPSIRLKARDGFCLVGPTMVPRSAAIDPDNLTLTYAVDGQEIRTASTSGMLRSAASLLEAITDFMTLSPGDLVMLGVPAGAPRVTVGQHLRFDLEQVGRVDARFVGEVA